MKPAIPDINYNALEREGFTILGDLLCPKLLQDFEGAIEGFATSECERLGITPREGEKFIDLFHRGGSYWAQLYTYLEKLFVLQEMSVALGNLLRESQFLSWANIQTPLIWPDIRVDPPGDETQLLRMHQDFGSTRCHRAWRLWVPLGKADEHHGTMRVVPGSHRRGFLPHDVSDSLYPFVDTSQYNAKDSVAIEMEAGSAVLFNPMLLHESVPNHSQRCRFTLLLQVQDLDTLHNPDDPEDPIQSMVALTETRARARRAQANVRSTGKANMGEYRLDDRSGNTRDFQFRRVTPGDLDELVKLHNTVQATLEEGFLYQRDYEFFAKLLQGQGDVMVASYDGKIVGYSSQRLLAEKEHVNYLPGRLLEQVSGGVALGSGSAVLPEFRGLGLLRLLVGWRRNLARNLGASHLIGITSLSVSYTHLTLPTTSALCRSRWSAYH